jgi:hypothetical protein
LQHGYAADPAHSLFAVLIVAVVAGVAWVGLTIAANIGIDVSLPNWISR